MDTPIKPSSILPINISPSPSHTSFIQPSPPKTDTNYIKYKKELDTLATYVHSNYIFNMFLNYGFTVVPSTSSIVFNDITQQTVPDNTFIQLESNINIYESIFIAMCVRIFCQNYKSNNPINVLEIGFAYGTSAVVLLNTLREYSKKYTYSIIDNSQTTTWKSIGQMNVENLAKSYVEENEPVEYIPFEYNLIEKDSTLAFNDITYPLHICFIDGAHSYEIVMEDLENTHKRLVLNGIMILDDVLHDGVNNAIIDFFGNKYAGCYSRMEVEVDKNNPNNIYFINAPELYVERGKIKNLKKAKSNYKAPPTMYCYMKISNTPTSLNRANTPKYTKKNNKFSRSIKKWGGKSGKSKYNTRKRKYTRKIR